MPTRSHESFRALPPHVRQDPEVLEVRLQQIEDRVSSLEETTSPLQGLLSSIPAPALVFLCGLALWLKPDIVLRLFRL